MRVLILAPRAPYPADHGAALRNLHLLSWLGARHEVSLVAFGDPEDRRARQVLSEVAREVVIIPPPTRARRDRLRALVTGEADLARRLWSPAFVAAVRERLQPPGVEVVHVEGLEVFALWEAARAGLAARPRVVFDAHNAEFALQASAAQASVRRGELLGAGYSLIQAARLRRYEARAARSADVVLAVSDDDAAALRGIGALARGDQAPVVVPNGVDPSYYGPEARPGDGATALFIGKLDYRPNVDAVEWLAREIWPRVRRRNPRARLRIVGRDVARSVERLSGRDGIEVIGPVVDERPSFHEADLLLVPMRMGGGVRLKVVQAMAMGLPVVATPAGVAGMRVQDGLHYLRAETASEFVDQVLRALADPLLRERLSATGVAYARQEYDWRAILPRLDRAYAALATTFS